MEEKKNIRNSNIEFIKIFAIFLIILSHVIPFLWEDFSLDSCIDVRLATKNIQYIILTIFKYGGQIGNLIFLVASAWFLIDNNSTKNKKICYMIADCFVISVAFLIIFMLGGAKFGKLAIISYIFPIIHRKNWFVGCYILLYMMHSLLNIIVNSISKKKFLIVNIVLFVFYCIIECYISMLGVTRYYYTEIIGMIIIYLFVAYVKKYLTEFVKDNKKNTMLLTISSLLLITSIIVFEFLGIRFRLLSNKVMESAIILNPFVIAIGMSIFNLFYNRKAFYNKRINFISSLSLLIYIFHDNGIFRKYILLYIWNFIYEKIGYRLVVCESIVISLMVFIISFLICTVYVFTIQKIVRKFIDYMYNKLAIKVDTLLDKMCKFE